MIRINLLQHREEKRQAQKRQMGVIAGGVVILGVLTVLLGYTFIAKMIGDQRGTNDYFKGEIAKLNKEIEEIKALKEKTNALLDRKRWWKIFKPIVPRRYTCSINWCGNSQKAFISRRSNKPAK